MIAAVAAMAIINNDGNGNGNTTAVTETTTDTATSSKAVARLPIPELAPSVGTGQLQKARKHFLPWPPSAVTTLPQRRDTLGALLTQCRRAFQVAPAVTLGGVQ